jgi:hypothetical protein
MILKQGSGLITAPRGMVLVNESSGIGSVPEITQVVTIDDNPPGTLHNTSFQISRSNGAGGQERVAVVMNAGALAEQFTLDFGTLTGLDFVTAGEGKTTHVYAQNGTGYTLWWNTGTETEPTGPANPNPIEVAINVVDDASAIAAATAGATVPDFSLGAIGTVTFFVCLTLGAVTDPDAGNSGATLTITVQGRNAASPVGGVAANLFAVISDGDNATDIATATRTATNGQGWTVAQNTATLTFTDSATGVRTDAGNNTTGFAITIIQQGTA